MIPTLITGLKTVIEFSTNGDDRSKAKEILKSYEEGKIEDEDCITFLAGISHEELEIKSDVEFDLH